MSETKTNSINKDLRKIKASSKRVGSFKNENTVRDFAFTIDEPVKLGGTNEAPTPMEYILGSFNGCVLIVIEMVAKEIDFTFEQLQAESIGLIDRRGLKGIDNINPQFQEVVNTIRFETEENEDRLEELKAIVRRRCPAYNLFKDSGMQISLNWSKLKGGETE